MQMNDIFENVFIDLEWADKKGFFAPFFRFAPEYERTSDAVSNFERAILQEKVATKLLYVQLLLYTKLSINSIYDSCG